MSKPTCRCFCTVAIAALVGCDAGDGAYTTARAAAPPRPPDRGRVLGGEPVERIVRWPRSIDGDTLRGFSPQSRAAVAEAPAPVLVPPATHPLAGGTVTAGPSWWAYTRSHAGVTLSIHASTKARVHPHVRPHAGSDRVRGLPGRAELAEGIRTLSWIEHGAAHALEIECETPTAAPCADDTLARSVAAVLTNVGGRGGPR